MNRLKRLLSLLLVGLVLVVANGCQGEAEQQRQLAEQQRQLAEAIMADSLHAARQLAEATADSLHAALQLAEARADSLHMALADCQAEE